MSTALPASAQARARATRLARKLPGESGIWAFTFCDLSVFSLYFVTFLYERSLNPSGFAAGTAALNMTIGVVSTLVLLTSSLFVAFAAQAIRRGRGAVAQLHVLAAAAGGMVFIVSKPIDWLGKVNAGHGPHHDVFFQIYFMMTGLHLLHVLVGMVVLACLWRMAGTVKALPTPRQSRYLENGATYWHLVDLIWLVLFALFYLVK